MASFMTSGDNVDWLWGSLKPWQILHSTLAERERFGSVLDVWELVNETLSASTTLRGQEGDGGRSHAMNFLGDIIDGDFWRHGGVMESRVKECLNALKDEEELNVSSHHLLHLPAAHHHRSLRTCANTDLTIASSTQLPCTPRSIAWKSAAAVDADDDLHPYCKVEDEHKEANAQERMLAPAAAATTAAAAVVAAAAAEEEEEEGEEGIRSYTEEEEEEDDEEEEEDEEVKEDEDSRSAPYTHIIREAANYSLMSANYQENREINRDEASVLVLNTYCCSAVAGDDQTAAQSANLEEGMAALPDLEENIEVCAVCLEKLTHYYEEGVQALACRHAFHTVCIGPWLQRQPHACCPCCRAPIFTDNLAPPLLLAAPLDLAADLHDRYACAPGVHEQQPASNDIMGLLADMEAALERLGFRS